MKRPMWRPWSCGLPQKTGSLRLGDDVVRDRDELLRRALERPAEPEQVAAAPVGDPVQHDRRDHLVGPGRRLQEARRSRPRPRRPASRRRSRAGCASQPAMPAKRRADPDRHVRADEVLALAADVEHAAAEGEGDGEAGEDQRRGDDQRLLEVDRRVRACEAGHPREEPVEAGAVEDRLVRGERVVAGCEHDEAADQEGEQRGDDRDDEAARALGEGHPCREARHRARRADLGELLLLLLGGSCGYWSSLTRPPSARRRSSRSRAAAR